MIKTDHAKERLQSRNIDPQLANLIATYGKIVKGTHDRKILKQEFIPKSFLQKVSPSLRAHIEHQLPIVGAIRNNVLVTVFKVTDRIRTKKPSLMDSTHRTQEA